MNSAEALRVLGVCEKELRQLVSSAAAEGDYNGVIKLTSWAKIVNGLVEDARAGRDPIHLVASERENDAPPNPTSRTVRAQIRSSKTVQKSRAGEYPKFFRLGEDLIKIGWSKRDRAEYQHKAPYEVLLQLVSKLTVVGSGGAIFTTEDILPLGADEGSPIPNYQGYLCLAWLRQEGLVQAHGRQGYSVVNGTSFRSATTTQWNELSSYAG